MLKHGEINQLDVFGLRQLEHCPPHFEIVEFELKTNLKVIIDWIYENLSGRFFIGDRLLYDNNSDSKKLHMIKVAAFELHEESSYFGLFLPNINVSNYDISF